MSESNLVKDNVNHETYASLLALWGTDDATREMNFLGVIDPILFGDDFTHDFCTKLDPEKKPDKDEEKSKEKRICKCLYYYTTNPGNCDSQCDYVLRKKRRRVSKDSEYSIVDYEVPPYKDDRIKHVGEVDLILKGPDGTLYATEVKPPKDNPETLRRMIAEIITYTLGGFTYKGETPRRAIAFFANSRQARAYKRDEKKQELKALLAAADITVFCFQKTEEAGEAEYKICKLYDPKS